jgi:Transposase DDE domain
MVWEDVLQRFVQQRPIPVMLRATLENVLPDSFFDALFEGQAQQQYTRQLTFSCLASLLSQVVLRVRPSVRAAAADRGLPASLSAVYAKLRGVEPAVCQALVQQAAGRLAGLFAHWPGAVRPDPVAGLRLRVLDGNYLAGTDRHLKPLRGSGAAALPGMVVALRDDRTGLLTHLLCREDAYTNERALLDEVLAWLQPDDLALADRNYCTPDFLRGVAARGAFFLVRHHQQLHLQALSPLAPAGVTARGEVYEQRVRLGVAPAGPECRCLVLRLFRPTRDGETEVVLLSNVPADQADALRLVELYLRRWTIERSWQELTEQLRCEVDTLAYPRAALLGFALAVLAYNLLAVLKGALASAHGQQKVDEELSGYALAEQVASAYEGLTVALPAEVWQRFGQMTAAQLADWLRQVAAGLRWQRFRKSKRGPKKPAQVKRTRRGAHRSTARLLQDRQKK